MKSRIASHNRLGIIIFLAVLVLGLVGCGIPSQPGQSGNGAAPVSEGAESREETIRIGLVTTLTGPGAVQGIPLKRGAEVAIKHINEQGGVLGKKLELIIRDDEYDASKAVTAVQELVTRRHIVAIIGPSGSSSALSSVDVLREAKIPVMAIASTSKLSTAELPGMFRIFPRDDYYATPIATYMARHFQKPALAYVDDALGKSQREQMEKYWREHGINPVAIVAFDKSEKDFTGVVQQLRASGADAVYVSGASPMIANIITTAKRLGYRPQFFGAISIAVMDFRQLAREDSNGVMFPYFPYPFDPRLQGNPDLPRIEWNMSEIAKNFYETWKTDYEHRKIEYSGRTIYEIPSHDQFAYDAVRIIAEAINKAGTTDPTTLVKTIEDIGKFSYLGRYEFSPADHEGLAIEDMRLGRIKDGILEFNIEW